MTTTNISAIADAIADKLGLEADGHISVKEITVSVTYSVEPNLTWLEDWYEKAQEEIDIPFD